MTTRRVKRDDQVFLENLGGKEVLDLERIWLVKTIRLLPDEYDEGDIAESAREQLQIACTSMKLVRETIQELIKGGFIESSKDVIIESLGPKRSQGPGGSAGGTRT